MRWTARLAVLTAVCMFGWLFAGASHAKADFGVANFEAGTCETSTCTYADSDEFYTQAGGHPPFGIIDFRFNTIPFPIEGFPLAELPDGNVLTVRTDLPRGLSVNPEAVPKCTQAEIESLAGCPENTRVGTSYVSTLHTLLGPVTLPFPVYNMEPPPNKPLMAAVRINVLGVVDETVYLVGDVEWEGDYHQFFEIDHIGNTVPVIGNRLVFDGTAGLGGSTGMGFIRLPTQCGDNPVTGLAVTSYQDPDTVLTYSTTTPAAVSDCDAMPFDPSVSVETGSQTTDSPSAVKVEVEMPQGSDQIKPSDIRNVDVTMPRGMRLNPAAAKGLETCTDAQFGKGTRNEINCPPASRIGTVQIETPVLPEGSLTGHAYAGRPLSNDPASGKQFRVFMDATSDRYGVSVRLVGEVVVDPRTGRLITKLRDLPQAPFSTFTVNFDGGPRAILSTPKTCGPHQTTARFVPWSGEQAHEATSEFTLTTAPGGGACAATPGARAFSPGFEAGTQSRRAGVHSPLQVKMNRNDGQQEIKAAHINLPPGISAKLAGLPYCSEQAISAAMAAGRDGAAEKASPSCPAASRIGRVSITSGTGPAPYPVEGTAYLAGPYAGAPLSMVVITPAIAGPYDLGTVVVRAALLVHPNTAMVTAVTDAIPDRQRGVELDLRQIKVDVDRSNFSLNPTGCTARTFNGNLFGASGDPNNSAGWRIFAVSSPYQATDCARLGFAPRLFTRVFGGRKKARRSAHPPFRAVLQPRPGQANISRAVLRLPPAIILDQSNIGTVCTRDQWAADNCPTRSIYGFAVARSPLLDNPLRGRVYLRSSQTGLPDISADLRGQIRVELRGQIDSIGGSMRTTFRVVPDVPVSHFRMRIYGGKKGLLVVSRDLCARKRKVTSRFRAHNGKVVKMRTPLRVNCGRRHR